MLRGEHGFQAKEIAKLLEWLRTEPRFDVINLPYALLLGLAEPLRRELKAPICCTLQGEDLFLDGLGQTYRSESMSLIRAAMRSRRRVPAGERVLPGLHAAAISASRARRCGSCRSASTWTATRARPRAAQAAVHDRLSRADRAGEGPARAGRGLPRAPRTHDRASRPRLVAAGYLPPEHQRYLDGDPPQDARMGTRGGVRVPRRGRPRAEDRVPADRSTCSRCRRPTPSRRACSCSRRWPTACRSCSRAAARFPRWSSKTGGGVLVEPDDPAALADALPRALAEPRPAAALGARRRGRRARALRRRAHGRSGRAAPTSRSAAHTDQPTC